MAAKIDIDIDGNLQGCMLLLDIDGNLHDIDGNLQEIDIDGNLQDSAACLAAKRPLGCPLLGGSRL